MILFKKPQLVLRVISNYYKIFVLKKKIVRKVEMGVTFKCQCDCAKCSSHYMHDTTKIKLSIDEIKKAAREIIKLGAIQINFTGGEPLLEDRIFEIIACFEPQKVLITVNTNGLLLTKDMIDRLTEAGVDILKISLDSPIPEEHDKSRVFDGCFDQIVSALSYIKTKKNIMAQISTVCIKENLNSDRIWKLSKMAKDYDALLGLTIPAASGRWVNNEKVLISKQEQDVLCELQKKRHVIRDTEESYTRSHCPAGSEEFYLTCYGDIIPCPLIQISFGNIRERRVEDIWNEMMDFNGFKIGSSPGCLAGENRDFISNYLLPLKDEKILPLHIKKHPKCLNNCK